MLWGNKGDFVHVKSPSKAAPQNELVHYLKVSITIILKHQDFSWCFL
jgi:hypothetical protein